MLVLGLALGTLSPVVAQEGTPGSDPDEPPFSLPFADPPGPTTWLYEQHYGNTTAAFNYGDVWYEFGQGLHFGIDFEAPCGTPVLAIADGVVAYVDAEGFGAGPHNLVLDHPGTGYASLYGHLLQQPALIRGQTATRGQQIGLSGDPDGSCGSRPHLHLEIREEGYQVALNPVPFFDVNWHMIASIGPFTNGFQQDLDAPYRWMKLDDQPDVHFSANFLNNYSHPWPPRIELRAPVNPPVDRRLDPLPDEVTVSRAAVALDQWSLGAWWDARDPDAVYLIDAVPDQDAGVFRQPLDGSPRRYVQPAPPPLVSPDGSVTVEYVGGGNMRIERRLTGETWDVFTNGNYPAVSPDGTRLLWEVVHGNYLPGSTLPGVAMWISNLDGTQRRQVYTQAGGYSQWLDSHRLLIVKRPPYTAETQLYILDVDDPRVQPELLGIYRFLHGLKIAPGGGMIAFYMPFQEDAAQSGVYVQLTEIGTSPRQLDVFGAYEWRDNRSLYVLSFDAAQDAAQGAHALGVVDSQSGDHRWLTDPDDLPIRVANGDWSVSPDGTRLVYVDPTDYGLYVLTVGE